MSEQPDRGPEKPSYSELLDSIGTGPLVALALSFAILAVFGIVVMDAGMSAITVPLIGIVIVFSVLRALSAR